MESPTRRARSSSGSRTPFTTNWTPMHMVRKLMLRVMAFMPTVPMNFAPRPARRDTAYVTTAITMIAMMMAT